VIDPKTMKIDWDATKVFLILAKRVDAGQLPLLREKAEQTGAAVSIFAMGEAAQQPGLKGIAEKSGGIFLSLNESMINAWASRVVKAMDNAPAPPARN
jgi:hypothetical protein